jgi:hypothetical protein
MTKALTHADIRKVLTDFGAAIKLDQRRVDAMPTASFHPMYDPQMWRSWRSRHVSFIEGLLPTVDAMPLAMLAELTEIATTYQPRVVVETVLENFADAVSGACSAEEFATAERFFGWVIKGLKQSVSGRQRASLARKAIAQWLPSSDPLRIARDSECQYLLPRSV